VHPASGARSLTSAISVVRRGRVQHIASLA
jgi:hypothetical protein